MIKKSIVMSNFSRKKKTKHYFILSSNFKVAYFKNIEMNNAKKLDELTTEVVRKVYIIKNTTFSCLKKGSTYFTLCILYLTCKLDGTKDQPNNKTCVQKRCSMFAGHF